MKICCASKAIPDRTIASSHCDGDALYALNLRLIQKNICVQVILERLVEKYLSNFRILKTKEMNSVLGTAWSLKHALEMSELIAEIESDFHVDIDPSTTSQLTLYDDFDANLWNADLLLCQNENRIFRLTKGSDCIGSVRATAKTRFWWDLPDGKVRRRLERHIGLRAVMPIASVKLTTASFSLRNNDQKIVVRGQLLTSVAGDCHKYYMGLHQMRGYKKDFLRARKILKPLLDREKPGFDLKQIFTEQIPGIAQNDTHQTLHLLPDMPTELVVRAMACELVNHTASHVDGIVSDIDTVFLHQFRVSVRKLRSLISLLKKSLSASTVEVVAPRLTLIAARTSRLRDLDVFLLDKNHYRAMLPSTHDAGLDELYVFVEKQRQQEKTRVARYFLSKSYKQDILTCQSELSKTPTFPTAMSRKPVLLAAKSLLLRRYRAIHSMSARLSAASDDEDVHDIRKELKKFRYLIEFFVKLLPQKRTARLLDRLKKLQVILGQFNDYCVQIEFLNSFNDDRQIEMTKALSGLVAILYHRQIETRKQVEKALALFFTEEIAIEIELAFGEKASGESK